MSLYTCADVDRRRANVEVIMPQLDTERDVPPESVGSDAASSALDNPSLIERAIEKLPPDLQTQAVGKKRKARSQDPGWKYGWWEDLTKKDFVTCIFCRKMVPSGISRFKHHLAGCYGDVLGCPRCPEIVKKKMLAYFKKNSRIVPVAAQVEDEEEQVDAVVEEAEAAAEPVPSSGIKVKQVKKKIAQASISAAAKPGTQKYSRSPQEGRRVENIILSVQFWGKGESCLKASQPLLVALRIADEDETPAAAEIMTAMDVAKAAIKESLKHKPEFLKQVLHYYDNRWENQMEQKLYGATLFLNPSKFFAIKKKNMRQASRLRLMFNQVMWKMVSEEEEQNKISMQADDYERAEGESFSMQGAIRDRDRKNPILWWGAYGGATFELRCLAKRIVSLCCPASGCERNWSDFSAQGGVQQGGGNLTWAQVDEAIGATQELEGRNMPRAAHAAPVSQTYQRTRKRPRTTISDIDEDGDERQDQNAESNSATLMEEDEVAAAEDGDEGFRVNDDLLD
ncbi:hAT dimerisation domain-containing protein / transposase-related [Striga hermonthica]|uniref:HAT dimerisation domain-containing protein / transposase-related n=1 Tax=Striga hermonthica TaxID=68872 RepID=A0A9N7NHF7_STRHE|nr:hAT dimerisation domain-containing protein / transposase-related [Striga hermonthica]